MSVDKKVINFMGPRRYVGAFSVLLLLVAIGSLAIKGLNFGLDFTGGTLIEVLYEEPVELPAVRDSLAQAGYENAIVVNFGSESDVLVRLPQGMSPELGEQVLSVLRGDANGEIEIKRMEFVGPQVGEQLREQGGLAVLLALVVVLIYIAMRFQIKFAVAAVAALLHDVIITLGTFSLMSWDFDLTVLAAILAVIGYSLNDTIVVADRIRENLRKLRKQTPFDVVNISLTDTLDRTLVTSGTTMLVLVALAIFGGDMIHSFALALIIGIAVGTYSSVYVVANLLLAMNVSQDDLIVIQKEGAEVDDLP